MTRISSMKFREVFNHVRHDVSHFYQSHMAKGLEKMQSKLVNVDCIIEVHDARIPLSGRNYKFNEAVMVRPHLLVLNKMDLVPINYRRKIEDFLVKEGVSKVLYANCKENADHTIRMKLLPAVFELIDNSDRFHRDGKDSFNLLVIGLPNVGKSSLINALRTTHTNMGGKAAPVGAMPGITRAVMEKIRVCEKPLVYVFDTPGIMLPSIPDMDVAMKLALCATMKENQIGLFTVADYLLFVLNKYSHFGYVKKYKLDKPTDDILILLASIAKQRNAIQKIRSRSGGGYVYQPNFTVACETFLRDFRGGNLGRINLDEDLIEKYILKKETDVS